MAVGVRECVRACVYMRLCLFVCLRVCVLHQAFCSEASKMFKNENTPLGQFVSKLCVNWTIVFRFY
jgi:hypothetical protein